jgi:hypothetical protein
VQRGGGAGIDTDKAKRWDISRLWYEADDPVASSSALGAALRRGIDVGLMRDPDWIRAPRTNRSVAIELDNDLTQHGFDHATSPDGCGAMLDNERQNAAGIVTMLQTFRQLRPRRLLRWTLQPWQGGWVAASPELVHLINTDPNLIVVVQNYLGPGPGHPADMFPCAGDQVIDNLAAAGVRRDLLTLFLDFVRTPPQYGWAGIVYDFAALPDAPPFPL